MKISTLTNPSRRKFALGLTSVLALVPFAKPAMATDKGKAVVLVSSLVASINRVIDSGKSEAAMIREFEKIFIKYSDVRHLARSALGVDGRRATAAQRRNFQKVFQSYIARKYGRQFRKFIGGKLEVQSAQVIRTRVEVTTLAHLRGQAPFEVTFFVSDRSGKVVFYNMFIEGINMLLTERTEIGAMLDRRGGNIDKMIRDLKTAG